MALHLVVIGGKLKLLAGTGGHGNWKLLAALLCPFALKLPFATRMPASYSDLAVSVRLFLFRLNRIVFRGDEADGRWGRALRLFHERAAGSGAGRAAAAVVRSHEDAFTAFSMLAL